MRPGNSGSSAGIRADGGDSWGPRTRYKPVPSPGGTCEVTAGGRLVTARMAGPGGLTPVTNTAAFSTREDGI